MYYLFSTTQLEFAKRFQLLLQQKFQAELVIQQENEYFHLFVKHADPQVIAQIQQFAQQFMQDPHSAQINQDEWQNGTPLSFSQIYQPFKSLSIRTILHQLFAQPFTSFITFLCILIYVLTTIDRQSIYLSLHFPELPDQAEEIWRYFSHTLVHLSLSHLLFNLLWWWLFARLIERNQGIMRIICLYLISSIISGFAQYFASGATFFGLSGVVYAVLGYVWLESYFDRTKQFNVPTGFSWLLIIGIISGFFSPLLGISIGNSAHISGLICGCIFAGIDIFWKKHKSL